MGPRPYPHSGVSGLCLEALVCGALVPGVGPALHPEPVWGVESSHLQPRVRPGQLPGVRAGRLHRPTLLRSVPSTCDSRNPQPELPGGLAQVGPGGNSKDTRDPPSLPAPIPAGGQGPPPGTGQTGHRVLGHPWQGGAHTRAQRVGDRRAVVAGPGWGQCGPVGEAASHTGPADQWPAARGPRQGAQGRQDLGQEKSAVPCLGPGPGPGEPLTLQPQRHQGLAKPSCPQTRAQGRRGLCLPGP